MPMYNLIEYSNDYSETLESLWQYYRDKSNATLVHFESFKSKIKIKIIAPADCSTKDTEIAAPLNYWNNFWRTLKTTSINCEGNLILTWLFTCVITNSTGTGTCKKKQKQNFMFRL